MNAELFAAFLVAATVLIASPGPVNVTVMAHAVQLGWRAAMVTNAGACLSLAVQLMLTVIGVNAVLMLHGPAFDLLRWLGAAYLAYLGIEQWRAAGNSDGKPPPSTASLFWQGLLVSSTNPKSLLVFPAYFPQFVDPAAPASPQLVLLTLTFGLMSALAFAGMAALAHRLQPHFSVRRRARLRDRIFGGALVLMAVGMVVGI